MSNYLRYFNENSKNVFITFVTYNRKEILLQNIDIFRESFRFAKTKFKFEIIAICVMKNHCHLIISLENSQEIPQIIRTIKFNFSQNVDIKYCENNLSNSAIKRGEKGVWQRRYYDHVIRNEQDLYRHIDYIHYNSFKHYNIPPKDWKYSSFNKFVKNGFYQIDWCNYDDKHNINDLNIE